MNVLQNLVELYNHLPLDSTYRAVAKGILENLDTLRKDFTIYDLAELTDSSRTTVWRLVQKMGYVNFTDFRYALKAAILQYGYYNRILFTGREDDADAVLEMVKEQMRKSADILGRECPPEMLRELVKQMHIAKKIRFYFPFRLPMIYSLQQNLAITGKDAAYFCLLPDMLEDVECLDENSILCISCIEYAETIDMKEVFQKAKGCGAYIWLFGDGNSRYRHMADQVLMEDKVGIMSEIMAMDAIFLAISEHYRAIYIDN